MVVSCRRPGAGARLYIGSEPVFHDAPRNQPQHPPGAAARVLQTPLETDLLLWCRMLGSREEQDYRGITGGTVQDAGDGEQ